MSVGLGGPKKGAMEQVYFIDEIFEYQRYWADAKGIAPGFYARLLPPDLAAIRAKSIAKTDESSVAAQVVSQLAEAVPRTRRIVTALIPQANGSRKRVITESAWTESSTEPIDGQDEIDFNFLRACEAEGLAPVKRVDKSLKRAAITDEDGWEYAPDFPHFDRAKFFESKSESEKAFDAEWFLDFLTKTEGIPKHAATTACQALNEFLSKERKELDELAAAANADGAVASSAGTTKKPTTPKSARNSIFGGGGPLLMTDTGGLRSATTPSGAGGGGGGVAGPDEDEKIRVVEQKTTSLNGSAVATLTIEEIKDKIRNVTIELLSWESPASKALLKRIYEKIIEHGMMHY